MRGGDISNEVPMRVLVTLDCIIQRTPIVKRVLGLKIPDEDVTYSRQALAHFWRFADKFGYTLELVGYEYSQKDMDRVLADLDNLGTNPFNYATSYPVLADLVAELPYRPEVKGVVDLPNRALRYGSRYLNMEAMNGSR